MKLSSYCISCLVKRQEEDIRSNPNEDLKSDYMKEVLKVIYSSKENESAPVVIAKINQLHQQYFGSSYSFEKLKNEYNAKLLQMEESILIKINASTDKLLEAIKYARVGNYIDFGALGTVDDVKLDTLLSEAHTEIIDEKEYAQFCNDLERAKELVYLSDNCGEIVLDKLFIKVIQERYPRLNITLIVRGKPVLNDATIEDADMVGLTKMIEVIGNGTEVAGTFLPSISPVAKEKIDSADVIISKGQGNFETLQGCGHNIYYIFLCKCDWFVSRFNLERYKGVFINEKNLKN